MEIHNICHYKTLKKNCYFDRFWTHAQSRNQFKSRSLFLLRYEQYVNYGITTLNIIQYLTFWYINNLSFLSNFSVKVQIPWDSLKIFLRISFYQSSRWFIQSIVYWIVFNAMGFFSFRKGEFHYKYLIYLPMNCIVILGSLLSGLRSAEDNIGRSFANDTFSPQKDR